MKSAVLYIILSFVFIAGASAQTTDSETLQALLTEVRQPRSVVEVFAAAVPQAHITLQKLQFQQRVAETSDQWRELRREIDAEVDRQSKLKHQLAESSGG